MRLQRLHAFAVCAFRAGVDAEHLWLRGAVDVGVEDADAGTFGRQRQCQIDGGGGFADAALAGGDGDDVLDIGQQLHAALYAVRHDTATDIDGHIAGIRQGFQFVGDQLLDFGLYGLRRIAQHDVERDVVAVDLDVLHAFAADEVLAGIGVEQCLECFLNLRFCDGHAGILLLQSVG